MNRVTLYSNGTGVFERSYTLRNSEPHAVSLPIRNDSLDESQVQPVLCERGGAIQLLRTIAKSGRRKLIETRFWTSPALSLV